MALRRAKPVLFAAPAKPPVTLQEVKDQAVIEHDLDDRNVQRRLDAAISWVERRTGRRLITQTYDLAFGAFTPGEALVIPYPPLQSIVHLKYVDVDGVLKTLDPAEYTVRTNVEPGEVLPAYQKSWPSTRGVPDAVQVRYVCGFGDEGVDVPADIREAICVFTATRQAFKEDSVTGTIVTAAPRAIDDLLARWIKRRGRPSGRPR